MSLFVADCLNKMQELSDNSVDLVYLDPPFFTQKVQKLQNRDNTKEFQFSDTWDNLDEYLEFIKIRLLECRRLMKDTASIFLHCDRIASHHLRIVLDDVFGDKNFQSEIIWTYKRWSNSSKGLLNGHQNIYFYSKTGKFKFNKIYQDYSPTTNVDQILQERVRDKNGRSAYNRKEDGSIKIGAEKKGVPLSDVWDIPYLNPKAKERTGYPTQKPIILLERIINLVTDKGDLVLDPFCGSGTTLVAAHLLKRDYIGIDCSDEAVRLTQSRLEKPIKTTSLKLEKGISSYQTKSETELVILKSIDAIPVQRNKGIDGFLRSYYMGRPVSVRIQKPNERISDAKKQLIQASRSKNCSLMVLIVRTLNENELLNNNDDLPNLIIINSYDLVINEWINRNKVTIEKLTDKII